MAMSDNAPPAVSIGSRLHGLVLLTHPGPSAFHLTAIAVFALLAGRPNLNWSTFALVVGAHLAMVLALAILNDYADRQLDAAGNPAKPIPRGLVTPREALLATGLMSVVMAVALIPLPPLAWLFTALAIAVGIGYNFGLKSTPLSGLVFAVGLPMIPLYAFAGMGRALPLATLWLIPVVLPVGVALNLADSLPDLAEDEKYGARTLAVVLGPRRAFAVCNGLLVIATAVVVALTVTGVLNAPYGLLYAGIAVTVALLVVLHFRSGEHRIHHSRKAYFPFVVVVCLLLTASVIGGVLFDR